MQCWVGDGASHWVACLDVGRPVGQTTQEAITKHYYFYTVFVLWVGSVAFRICHRGTSAAWYGMGRIATLLLDADRCSAPVTFPPFALPSSVVEKILVEQAIAGHLVNHRAHVL